MENIPTPVRKVENLWVIKKTMQISNVDKESNLERFYRRISLDLRTMF